MINKQELGKLKMPAYKKSVKKSAPASDELELEFDLAAEEVEEPLEEEMGVAAEDEEVSLGDEMGIEDPSGEALAELTDEDLIAELKRRKAKPLA